MTIKEIEDLSGMTRANIRFYESQGLLTPARDTNGYRNYTEKDLEMLKRIRLLRTLHLNLDDIRAAGNGEKDLGNILADHLRHLKEEQRGLLQCQDVCEQMCRDHVAYNTFDAQHYLDLMDMPRHAAPPELEHDTVSKVTAPWRRFFAREIDLTLNSLLWSAFLTLVIGVNISEDFLVDASLSFLLVSTTGSLFITNVIVLLVEPLFLTFTGTTPGKFCFGLQVAADDGKRLTYREALRRTWDVLRKGYGFFIPIYWIIRMYKSYKACKNDETLYWEEDSVLSLNKGRLPLGICVTIAFIPFSVILQDILNQYAAIPPNTGDITVEEFCENFNDTQEFFGIERQLNLPPSITSGIAGIPDSALYLDDHAGWAKKPGTPYINQNGEYAPLPAFQFIEKNGVITGISFSYSVENENVKISSYGEIMALAAVSYVCAQSDYSVLPDSIRPDTPEEIFSLIREHGDYFEDFNFNEAGITVECNIDHEGYDLVFDSYDSAMLEPIYGEDAYFNINFSMSSR